MTETGLMKFDEIDDLLTCESVFTSAKYLYTKSIIFEEQNIWCRFVLHEFFLFMSLAAAINHHFFVTCLTEMEHN